MIEQNLCTSQHLDMDTHWTASYPCRGHGRSDIVLLQQPSVPAGRQGRGHLPDPSPALHTPHPYLPGLRREALYKQGWGCSPPGAETRVEDWALGTGNSSQIWAWPQFLSIFALCLFSPVQEKPCVGVEEEKTIKAMPFTEYLLCVRGTLVSSTTVT